MTTNLARPVAEVLVLSRESGLRRLGLGDITPDAIGQKAYGLTQIPKIWVPDFCCISTDWFTDLANATLSPAIRIRIDGAVSEMREVMGWADHFPVYIRSSGSSEGLSERGRYLSKQTNAAECCDTLLEVAAAIHARGVTGGMAFIVQSAVVPKTLHGHLSNERRLADDTRDWVAEYFEPSHAQGVVDPFQIKNISREKVDVPTALDCPYFDQILLKLREPARWATQNKLRMHFEWVWDGHRIWLVQADRVVETTRGKNPLEVPKVNPKTRVNNSAFQVLESFDLSDPKGFRKLKNVADYAKAGLPVVDFWLLDNVEVLSKLARGERVPELAQDLQILCASPIVMRSDVADVPTEDTQMLPRSDAISDYEVMIKKLLVSAQSLASVINSGKRVGFLFHRYLPAISSCFCYATPTDRRIRIESVWGIADGLSYFSHDTFEVDCGAGNLGDDIQGVVSKFASREKVRHKSRFLADSGNGDWVFEQVSPPWDRRRSITHESWIFLIAYFTKRFAQFVNQPINMMWFIGIDKQHVGSQLLPWYHEEATQLTRVSKAPDTRQIAGQYPTIRNSNDVEQLMHSPELRGSRVKAVRLDPDQSALRDRAFALKVAELSRTHQIRIELAGGILAHTYYLLVQHGAIVDCIDPFESAEDTETFGKLVRDKLPEKVSSGGEVVEYRQLTGEALISALKAKVLEESLEVFEAVGRGSLVEELADLEEVVAALCERLELDAGEIQKARSRKNKQRGSFDKGYVLLRTKTPRLERLPTETKLLNGTSIQGDARAIDGPLIECAASSSEVHRFTINVPLIPPHLTKEASTSLTFGQTTYNIAAKNAGKMVQLTVEVTAAPEQLPLFPELTSNPDSAPDDRNIEMAR